MQKRRSHFKVHCCIVRDLTGRLPMWHMHAIRAPDFQTSARNPRITLHLMLVSMEYGMLVSMEYGTYSLGLICLHSLLATSKSITTIPEQKPELYSNPCTPKHECLALHRLQEFKQKYVSCLTTHLEKPFVEAKQKFGGALSILTRGEEGV